MTQILSNTQAASIQKYEETSFIRIEINRRISILSIACGKIMRRKWPACHKTMKKRSFRNLFLNYYDKI